MLLRRLILPGLLLTGCSSTPPAPVDAGVDAGLCVSEARTKETLDLGVVFAGELRTNVLPPGDWLSSDGSRFFVVNQDLRVSRSAQGELRASLKHQVEPCVHDELTVIATAIERRLTWDPASVDFSNVALGRDRVVDVRFSNFDPVPVTLTVDAVRPAPFSLLEPGPWVVPAAARDTAGTWRPGVHTVQVRFLPANFGPLSGVVNLRSTSVTQPLVDLDLKAIGGGPFAVVDPTVLDFGDIFFTTTRPVALKNIGGPNGDISTLHMGRDGGEPYFELTPPGCGTAEFDLANTYQEGGLFDGQQVVIEVTMEDKMVRRQCLLTIYTDDPGARVIEVPVIAE